MIDTHRSVQGLYRRNLVSRYLDICKRSTKIIRPSCSPSSTGLQPIKQLAINMAQNSRMIYGVLATLWLETRASIDQIFNITRSSSEASIMAAQQWLSLSQALLPTKSFIHRHQFTAPAQTQEGRPPPTSYTYP